MTFLISPVLNVATHLGSLSNSLKDTVSRLFVVLRAYLGFVLASLKPQRCQINHKAPSYILNFREIPGTFF